MRSIPAHAGQPGVHHGPASAATVHPRSRGAARRHSSTAEAASGPSPLTRGSLWGDSMGARRVGSIPAHAGQPSPWPPSSTLARVHPRSRGAASSRSSSRRCSFGPSPLTRGSQRDEDRVVVAGRSIPAHAGQPTHRAAPTPSERVHPRSRGAATRARPIAPNTAGPSPLTRGSRGRRRQGILAAGSIPAHAGQPSSTSTSWCQKGVHPRSRGAAGIVGDDHHASPGPSPLTRGSRTARRGPPSGLRSIPAHAGQPSRCRRGRVRCSVHPRSRGAATTPTVSPI